MATETTQGLDRAGTRPLPPVERPGGAQRQEHPPEQQHPQVAVGAAEHERVAGLDRHHQDPDQDRHQPRSIAKGEHDSGHHRRPEHDLAEEFGAVHEQQRPAPVVDPHNRIVSRQDALVAVMNPDFGPAAGDIDQDDNPEHDPEHRQRANIGPKHRGEHRQDRGRTHPARKHLPGWFLDAGCGHPIHDGLGLGHLGTPGWRWRRGLSVSPLRSLPPIILDITPANRTSCRAVALLPERVRGRTGSAWHPKERMAQERQRRVAIPTND